MGDYAGRTGLESYYEKVLMGQRGVTNYIRDNKSRIQGAYETDCTIQPLLQVRTCT